MMAVVTTASAVFSVTVTGPSTQSANIQAVTCANFV
jgi:hypothetical protein